MLENGVELFAEVLLLGGNQSTVGKNQRLALLGGPQSDRTVSRAVRLEKTIYRTFLGQTGGLLTSFLPLAWILLSFLPILPASLFWIPFMLWSALFMV